MTAETELAALQAQLHQLRHEPGPANSLCAVARQAGALQAALPPRFAEVLLDLVDRLESSALFTEESCSFSQKDLLDTLQLWIDKARERLIAA